MVREHPVYSWREYTGVRLRERWLTDDDFARAIYWRVFAPELTLGSAVVDVGCGWGRFSWTLARAGCRVWAVDVSDRQRGYWRRISAAASGARFALADAAELPFRARAFDAAVCVGVLQDVRRPERVVREIARVLRPGGVLFVAAPNEPRLWDGKGSVTAVLEELRCSVTRCWGEGVHVPLLTPVLTWLTPYAATVSYRSRRLARLASASRWLYRVLVARTSA